MRYAPLLLLTLAACTPATPPPADPNASAAKLLPPLNDPFEPINRGVWAFNKGLLTGVVQPTGAAYRQVVPSPARRSVSNFSHNITYPGRLINHSLQGRWQGAGEETLRFLTNTTVGIGGLFDVATKWNIPRSEASFGQTFSKWGWQRGTYLMLPIAGPSDEVNATGYLADKTAEPWTYFPTPYNYGSAVTGYNELVKTSDQRAQFVKADGDSYQTTKYVWSYVDFKGEPDWKLTGPPEAGTLQTLQAASVACIDSTFPHRGDEVKTRLPGTGKIFVASAWIQKNPSPIVYISPGLGSHRLSPTPMSVAETLYQNGFSVVTTSSIFHPEFIESASTSSLPAYPPKDSVDLLAALTEVDKKLEARHPGKITRRALLGLSMGGFQTLNLAARDRQINSTLLRFERYIALNPPVELGRNVKVLDEFYDAPRQWPASSRREQLHNTIHKLYAIQSGRAPATVQIPFDTTESRFLIGLNFRFILRDTIYSSQSRHNLGVLKTPLHKWRRQAAYDEIMNYSFSDYFQQFAIPHYASHGITPAEFQRATNLRTYTTRLASDPRIRVITNSNDFLLNSSDRAWLRTTFSGKRLVIFPGGGHLGNLASPQTKSALLGSLEALR